MTAFDTQDCFFSQNDTKTIKGIAILFMVLHHSVAKFYT